MGFKKTYLQKNLTTKPKHVKQYQPSKGYYKI